ncbi:MAG: histidinol-phosphate transaminase [Alphaproteobacteria bacterium]|nr:histidinol-phosphate transaminase [Alphaproteobacteria bacterium]
MTQQPIPKPGIRDISPYTPGKSKMQGDARVIKLSSNENPWGPSPKAIAAFQSLAGELHRYPDGGHATLREAIADSQHLPAAQIICGAGSDELIGMLVHAYAGVGDEVLYTAHGFLMYKIYALGNGATPVTAPEKDLHTDVDALLAAVTPRTKIVFVANPNNPTGTVIPFSEIRRLRAGLREDIILGLDAAYAEYLDSPDYEDGLRLVKEGSNTVVFHTFSKIHGLPALRLGWAFAPAPMIDVLNRVRSPFNVSAPALAAGVAAIGDAGYLAAMRAKNAAERARVAQAIAAHGYLVVPSVTNFVLVRFGEDTAKVNAHLAAHGLIVREVAAYGLPDYLRISIGTAEENTLLLAALDAFAKARAA